MNEVKLMGNLGNNPEGRFTSTGQPVTNFNLATNENWTDKKSGEKRQRTEWHKIVTWGKTATACAQNLSKGRRVLVSGKIRTREWTDANDITRYSTEIHAFNVQFLDSKPQVEAEVEENQSTDEELQLDSEAEQVFSGVDTQ